MALLQTCLNHNLRPSSRDSDPPHAKIASDVVSCIFLVSNWLIFTIFLLFLFFLKVYDIMELFNVFILLLHIMLH